jgi:calcineurin-like phosphoesterase family protein
MLRLLHLSDIHFDEKNSLSDSNIDVKDGIEFDLQCLMKTYPSPVDYILVCGDVAFSGKKSEYDKAKTWLDKLCEIVKCKPSSVMIVPGNHDVDRSLLKGSYIQELLHQEIRSKSESGINKTFERIIDTKELHYLKKPQSSYEEFAAIYDCVVKEDQIIWEGKLDTINDIDIILRGCNSALLADENDNDFKDKMALSKYQYYIKDNLNVIYITMCHHPTECIIDKNKVEESFDEKAILQLYGHNHKYNIEPKERSIILHAGAIKPEESETDRPCYNIIDIDINDNIFNLTVWTREWDGKVFNTGCKDGSQFENHSISIPNRMSNWKMPTKKESNSMCKETSETKDFNVYVSQEDSTMDYTERDIRYKFLSLPFRKRKTIGNHLIPESFNDHSISEMNRSLSFLNMIKDEEKYNKLWQQINSQYE